jgi:hypothetical protein
MKNTFSLIIIFVACIVMAAGFTLSYFYGQTVDSQVQFTTGKLEVDLTKTIDGGSSNWEPGVNNKKTVTWTFENIGTHNANLKFKLNNIWAKSETVATLAYLNDFSLSEDDPEPKVSWVLRTECLDSWEEKDDGYYYKGVIKPNEIIDVSFDLTLEGLHASYLGANYNVTLTIEADQER